VERRLRKSKSEKLKLRWTGRSPGLSAAVQAKVRSAVARHGIAGYYGNATPEDGLLKRGDDGAPAVCALVRVGTDGMALVAGYGSNQNQSSPRGLKRDKGGSQINMVGQIGYHSTLLSLSDGLPCLSMLVRYASRVKLSTRSS
jgi:hypothetical protein